MCFGPWDARLVALTGILFTLFLGVIMAAGRRRRG